MADAADYAVATHNLALASQGGPVAVDNTKTEWHLTPRGWVVGKSTFFENPDGATIERPEDAVETWVDSLYQKSGWSEEEKSWHMIWSSEVISREERDKIRKLFPNPIKG